ncbi:MAG: polyphosphate kinase 2 [Pseudomonadota bacterium]|nr:polyphosphate kinase 2 [Pseudomonadota bacterium]
MNRAPYRAKLRRLQIELVKLQKHFIGCGDKILILIEGRDAAGKDGVVKRVVRHLSPRETRVVALGPPSDRERGSWYFQRFVAQLPAPGEFVLFNRSWYNRAGVERVMGFCSEDDYRRFVGQVVHFERMLVDSGVCLLKYYLDISRDEQARRLAARLEDPLKQWKISPVDGQAQALWNDYSLARDAMLVATDHAAAPWNIVAADDKRRARVALISDLLQRIDYCDKDPSQFAIDDLACYAYTQVHKGRRKLAV